MEKAQVIRLNIEESKKRIKEELLKDNLIIFFTRILEDLKRFDNPNFYGRVKDLYFLIYPYSDEENTKKIFLEILKRDLSSKEGLLLDDEEKNFVRIVLSNLNEDCRFKYPKIMKGRINGILNILSKKYLPNSSNQIEPYILGKLISFFGGIKNLCFKPAGTLQLIGSEKALFRHISKGSSSPKYGLLYYSKYIQQASNKGREARRIANKLSISLRQDYFNYIRSKNEETK